jgi:hypothetical protein
MLVDKTQAIPLALGQYLDRVHDAPQKRTPSSASKRRLSRRVYFAAWFIAARVILYRTIRRA